MKASMNACSCSQTLGQWLKSFLSGVECVSFLERQAGDQTERRTGKPTFLFVLAEHLNPVQTTRSFHGANTTEVFSLAELQHTAFPKEQGKALVENTVCIMLLAGQNQLLNYSEERVE